MYETFEHTADLGLRIRAPDRETLFVEAAQALFSAIIEDCTSVRPERKVTIQLPTEEVDYLLFDWLKSLLYHFDVDHLLFSRFEVHFTSSLTGSGLTGSGLTGSAWGEPFDPDRHALEHEVKAITYHGLRVEQTKHGWLAEIIVDI